MSRRSRRTQPHQRRILGLALVAAGLAADAGVGAVILAQASAWVLLVHVLAALIWALGISVLDEHAMLVQRHATVKPGWNWLNRQIAGLISVPFDSRTVTAALLGLLLFPGLGPIGCTLAFGAARLARASHKEKTGIVDDPGTAVAAIPRGRSLDPTMPLEIQPLVDVLRGPSTERKRAAIAALGRQSNLREVRLLRQLLTDSDPDVRSDASVILSRLENDCSRALGEASTQAREHLAGVRRYVDLCHRYSVSNLLDETSSAFYLAQAHDTLQEVLAREPEQIDLWIVLARIHCDRGEPEAARAALDRALSLSPRAAEGLLLRMELAFFERDWEHLITLAQQRQEAPQSDPELRGLLQWWAEAG